MGGLKNRWVKKMIKNNKDKIGQKDKKE